LKAPSFAIFFAIVLAIYASANYYIFIRGWQSIPADSPQRKYYLVVFLLLSLSFIAGRFLERLWVSWVTNLIIWVGSFWLAAMLYFFIIIILLDLIRLLNHILPIIPSIILNNYVAARQITGYAAGALVLVLLIAGHLNARFPRIKRLDLSISKALETAPNLKIAVASDIHLGTIIGRARLDKLAEKINALHPDLIILAGDIVDEDIGVAIRENLGESLRSLKAPLGVFAITGNHEYYAGVEEACRYLADHNVTVIRDSVVKINGDISLVGREDREYNRFMGKKRKTLTELLSGVDPSKPIILLDHEPFHLEEAVGAKVDLQISGHTHDGQLWPIHYIDALLFEIPAGYGLIGNTQFYVSTGFGTWGPPVRLGNRPEIVEINLKFK